MTDATNADVPAGGPLQDRTNAPVLTAADIEARDREIAHLKGLIDGFTKKKGRGRKRVHDNEEGPAAKKSKDDTRIDYIGYGRTIGRFLGPFVNIGNVVEYGCTVDTAMSGNEGETDEHLEEAWKILWSKFPRFHEYLLSLSKELTTRRAIIKQMTIGLEGVRSDNTATLKRGIPGWLTKDKTPLDPPLASLTSKTHRGFAHPVFARLLTPMEWAPNEETWIAIAGKTLVVTSSQLPAFVFPLDQEFPLDIADLEDDAWIAVLDNALKGEVLLWAIFMGPEAALQGDGYHKGRPGNASIIMLLTFTPRVIAWVVAQVYFALSAKTEWYKTEGDHFDYDTFFWTMYNLFDNEEWGGEIIALWNKVVLGLVKATAPSTTASGPTPLERVKAARSRKRAAAAAAATAPAPATVTAPAPAASPSTVPTA
ncbi:hypothetical protein DFH07DRAFT_971031 [Mycena maculata]|uniref:Uncharacterized protein n=1 Tax=Mycena maculata TaxID=230809 RepID=A0AAD7HP91_9AGAR|nr:hypothetical protein DFH07DRAFT_971031 [Mycena maculata]